MTVDTDCVGMFCQCLMSKRKVPDRSSQQKTVSYMIIASWLANCCVSLLSGAGSFSSFAPKFRKSFKFQLLFQGVSKFQVTQIGESLM